MSNQSSNSSYCYSSRDVSSGNSSSSRDVLAPEMCASADVSGPDGITAAARHVDSRSTSTGASTNEFGLAPAQAIPTHPQDVVPVHAAASENRTQLAQALLLALAISAVAHMEQHTGLSTQQHAAHGLKALQQQVEQERLPSKQQQELSSADQQKSLRQQDQVSTESLRLMQAKKQVQDQAAAHPCRQLWQQEDDTKHPAGDTAPQHTMPAQLQLLVEEPILQQLHAQRPEREAAPATDMPAPPSLSHQEWLSAQQQEFAHLQEQLEQQAQELQKLQRSRSAATALQKQKLQDRESQLQAEAASLRELQQHHAVRKQALDQEHRLLLLQHKQECTTGMLLQRAKLGLQHQHLQDKQHRLSVQQHELSTDQRELQDQWFRFEQERAAWQSQQAPKAGAEGFRHQQGLDSEGQHTQQEGQAVPAGATTPGRHGSRALPADWQLQQGQHAL